MLSGLNVYVWIGVTILFVVGGLGTVNFLLTISGVFVSYILLYFYFLKNKKITFPPGSLYYLTFLIIYLISLFWSKDVVTSLIYFLMFTVGGIFWLFFYNYRPEKVLGMPFFESMVIILGLIFGAISLFNISYNPTYYNASGLINYTVGSFDHMHIGDFWAPIIGLVIYALFLKRWKPILLYIFLTLGFMFLLISFSRSAYVSLIAGLIFIESRLKLFPKATKTIKLLLIPVGFLVIWSSINKGFISHRLFYITGFLGSLNNIFGTGFGGFGGILRTKVDLMQSFGYSSVADNIILEMIAGLGILSLSFIYWLIRTVKKVITDVNPSSDIYSIFFIILTVNFMFDHTYLIPTVNWLWFSALGLSQANREIKS